jgi:hypothetical protein
LAAALSPQAVRRIWQPEVMRFVAAMSLFCLVLAGCGGGGTPSASHRAPAKSRSDTPADGPVLLGSKSFIVWGGLGFGTAHPSKIVVGSDPSVMITGIRWHGWGRRTASGVGHYSVPHFGHGGDYYAKKFRADLRVAGIGTCWRNGPRTYMALKVKVALQPGQRPSWYEADGSHGLCSYP